MKCRLECPPSFLSAVVSFTWVRECMVKSKIKKHQKVVINGAIKATEHTLNQKKSYSSALGQGKVIIYHGKTKHMHQISHVSESLLSTNISKTDYPLATQSANKEWRLSFFRFQSSWVFLFPLRINPRGGHSHEQNSPPNTDGSFPWACFMRRKQALPEGDLEHLMP